MGKFKIDKETKEHLRKLGQEKASNLANDAREKLSNYYISLLDWYYADYTPQKYERTFNLYKSCRPYRKNSHGSIYYGGVMINSDHMSDYKSIHGGIFSAERLLDKYIYVSTYPSATWHGGDWHGGYGEMASFSIFEYLQNYRNELIKQYKNN